MFAAVPLMKIACLGLVLASFAIGQSNQQNSITLSSGVMFDQKSPCCHSDTAASLGITYGYRLFRYLQLEAGLTGALDPTPESRGASYDIKPDGHFIWVPFGIQAVLPIVHQRLELSAGAGGIYENYSNAGPAFNGPASRSGLGGYFSAGMAVAIDRRHRFWVGASSRLSLVNANQYHDRYIVTAGDFGFRF